MASEGVLYQTGREVNRPNLAHPSNLNNHHDFFFLQPAPAAADEASEQLKAKLAALEAEGASLKAELALARDQLRVVDNMPPSGGAPLDKAVTPVRRALRAKNGEIQRLQVIIV